MKLINLNQNQHFLFSLSQDTLKNGFNFPDGQNYFHIQNELGFLLIKGFFYSDFNIEDFFKEISTETLPDVLSVLDGYFCGMFYNAKTHHFHAFTDKMGYFDLYYEFKSGVLIISDDFAQIMKKTQYSFENIEIEALYEFLLLEYPLFGKTFLKSVKTMPIGGILTFTPDDSKISLEIYADYTFTIDESLSFNDGLDKLNVLFENAIQKIKNLFPDSYTFSIGLSGGMDSRLFAYLAIKNNIQLNSFIFGEKKSDACRIARQISKKLAIDHYEVGYKQDFYRYIEDCTIFNPMMNLQYAWYYAIWDRLPQFDWLFTGFNGGNQFGSRLTKKELTISSDQDFAIRILDGFSEIGRGSDITRYFKENEIYTHSVLRNIEEFSKKSKNREFWQKDEEFNYKNRQNILIKNNPSFHFLGKYNSISIFMDPQLNEFTRTIPFKYRLDKGLYFKYFEKFVPEMYAIRPERELPLKYNKGFLASVFGKVMGILNRLKINFFFKNHKQLNEWLSKDKNFSLFLGEILENMHPNVQKVLEIGQVQDLFTKGKWTHKEISLLFRLLTIIKFIELVK